jgi:hypothetical protein
VTRVTGRIALWGTLGAPAELTEYPGLAKTAFADADRLFRAIKRLKVPPGAQRRGVVRRVPAPRGEAARALPAARGGVARRLEAGLQRRSDRLVRALERRIPKSRTAPSDEPAPA